MENQKFNPVVWFEIYVDDIDRATKFYEEILQIKLQEMSDPTNEAIIMKAFPGDPFNSGASGTLVKLEGMKAGGGGTMVYFFSTDCSIEQSRVEAAGGKISQPKTSLGEYGFCPIVTDTEGNTFGIHSMQ